MKIIDNILLVSNDTLNKLNTSYVNQYELHHDSSYFHGESGKEHYRLLMYISSLYNNKILFDVGTNRCMSAISLSSNIFITVKFFNYFSYCVMIKAKTTTMLIYIDLTFFEKN